MSKIIDAVSIVMTHEDEIFAIQRQNFLRAFPGYWAFPGGKVDEGDDSFFLDHSVLKGIDARLFGALVREAQEELGIDMREEIKAGRIERVDFLGLAVTPDFNPYRYATYFFKISVKEKVTFVVDENEAQVATWIKSSKLLEQFEDGQILAVPPVIKVIETLGHNPATQSIPDLNFEYDGSQYVPYIESIKSLRQIMPLSNTLPPAYRTNAFLIGDGDHPKVLVDPSPKDQDEYRKFKNTLDLFGVDKIFLTHHHYDHHERATDLAREYQVPVLLSAYTHQKILGKRPEYFAGIKVEVAREGDVLTHWLNRAVKVYEVPGHDEGQLALAPDDLSWFIAGDLFQGVGTVVIGGEEGDMQKYFRTLEKVISLSPKVLFPSHGIGLGGVNILIKTLEHRKLREEQVFKLVQEGKSEEEMLAQLYSDISPKLWPYALENIRKHIKKLHDDGRC